MKNRILSLLLAALLCLGLLPLTALAEDDSLSLPTTVDIQTSTVCTKISGECRKGGNMIVVFHGGEIISGIPFTVSAEAQETGVGAKIASVPINGGAGEECSVYVCITEADWETLKNNRPGQILNATLNYDIYTSSLDGAKIGEGSVVLFIHTATPAQKPNDETEPVTPPALNDYYLTLYGNGGSAQSNSGRTFKQIAVVSETEAYTLPECPFERAGYTFAGWSADYGNTVTGQPGDTVTLTNRLTFLYAMWEKIDVPTVMAGEVLAQGDTPTGVHWTFYDNGTLNLRPGVRYMEREIDRQWEQKYKQKIISLVVEDGIRYIDQDMFAGYPLEKVSLPDMRGILPEAFSGCRYLKTVEIRGSVDQIGPNAFYGCNALNSFTVNGTVWQVGGAAFLDCTSLTAFNAPVTYAIDDEAFEGSALSGIGAIRGSVGKDVFEYTNMNGKTVYLVSSKNGTLAENSMSFINYDKDEYSSGSVDLRYTGTEAEFQARYVNNSGVTPKYQYLGDNVTWSLDKNGVLTISGSGKTIDLLDWGEQPWLYLPDQGYAADAGQVKKVVVDGSVILGAHMLDYLEDKVEYTAPPEVSVPPEGSPFTDVSPEDWFHDAVDYAYAGGYMRGTAPGIFSPEEPMTRAMAVTVLHRLAGAPEGPAAPFPDVAAGSWYEKAVGWAAEAGIVKGYETGEFGPEDMLTREQLATLLYRYEKTLGRGFQGAWDFQLSYDDAGDISPFADEAMHYMVMEGILRGRTPSTLNPLEEVTRAEMATILMRYLTGPGAVSEDPPGGQPSPGQEIAVYACSLIGVTPYVHGGNSLTSGTDDAGFIHLVYADFGIDVPRIDYDYLFFGDEVSYNEAQPGDIVCYSGHVAIYIGSGLVVHAKDESSGTVISHATYRPILTVRRVT